MVDAGSLCRQLAADGYCIVDQHEEYDSLRDIAEIIGDWFKHASQQQKRDAAASPTDIAAGTGRGYFNVPVKDVFEVSQTWRGAGVGADLRLAAKSAFSTLQQVAKNTASSVLAQSNGFKVTEQQLKQILGQQHSKRSQLHSSSILHINNYRSAGTTATAVEAAAGGFGLQGCEAHVDKGLLTVIHATGPGLEVFSRDGSWIPIHPAPGQLVILVGHTLSFMTAGRLPAALHRIVIPAAAAINSISSRLSLCFKLHASPDAVLCPVEVTNTAAGQLATRYRVPKTTKQLLKEFDATHTSLHSLPVTAMAAYPAQLQPQPQQLSLQLPAVKRFAHTEESSSPNSSCEQAQKRQRTQPLEEDVCAPEQQREGKYLSIICRDQSGHDVVFKIKPTTKIGKVKDAYCAHRGSTGYRFYFNDVIGLNETPMSLGMVDMDVIDVFMEQIGD